MIISKSLTQQQKKKLVNIAWKEIEMFIKDWQRSPFKWNSERDIQAEIANRLKAAIGLSKNTFQANYGFFRRKGFSPKEQHFSRVSCEPAVYYTDANGKKQCCRPDILIWGDMQDPNSPQEPFYTKKNDPILWLCEIKFYPGWGRQTNKKSNWDFDKMRSLLWQESGMNACWIYFCREKENSGNGIKKRLLMGGRARRYVAKVSKK